MTIDGRKIGPGEPPYIIAEMSGNHNGSLQRALALIDVAKKAGADAVKLQTYTADTITIDHDGPEFTIRGGLWDGRTLYELYQEAHTPWAWQEELFTRGREIGITVFSSPFDETAVDFLEGLDAPAYKIASFEIVDLPLIERCAHTGKPLIVSTGMANLCEIQEAVNTARGAGCEQLVLLHCVSGYPAPAEEYNLATIRHMAETFRVPAGISDHTLGTAVSVAAAALGACVVEKHLTLKRVDGGPDAAFSLEPEEMRQMAQACRTAFASVGKVSYARGVSEQQNVVFRRSLYATKFIEEGERFSRQNIRSIRPGFGLSPKHLTKILGRRAAAPIERGTALTWKLIR
jgi:N-acetylneuraminate synthase